MPWNHNTEQILKKWGSRAQYQHILYEQASEQLRKRDRWFGLPLLILGVITTSTMFIQLDECQSIQQYISATLSFFYTLLNAIGNYIGYKERTRQYSEIASAYDDIVMDIQEQLEKDPKDRIQADSFVATVKSSIRKLKHAPSVPENIYEQYLQNIDQHFNSLGIEYNNQQGIPEILDPENELDNKDTENELDNKNTENELDNKNTHVELNKEDPTHISSEPDHKDVSTEPNHKNSKDITLEIRSSDATSDATEKRKEQLETHIYNQLSQRQRAYNMYLQ